jgi:Aerobic-type carbon monoxide dehydrogenase, middle subunit CoxM/CutM homologs
MFAHRGARAHAPENTIEAFELALKLGATGLESDVWLTADGEVVLDHDGEVKRGRLRKVPIGRLRRDELPEHIPTLSELANGIGDAQVRNRGTAGGSIANNDPAADYPAAVLALGATIHTDRRTIAADDYFQGLFDTALEDGELITKIAFPIPERAGYAKFINPASRYAMVGVLVAKTAGGVRVAVTGAGASGVFRVTAMEAALNASFTPDAVSGISVPASGLIGDLHASADYRAHLIGVMAKRAVAAAAA